MIALLFAADLLQADSLIMAGLALAAALVHALRLGLWKP